jgi:hypothetical protein
MYCPQCGTESSSGQQYCRSCGANLKVIGKALSLSEAIARSDRGPLPRLKEMVRSLNVEHVTEEVSGALDRMNKEILRSSTETPPRRSRWGFQKKTAEERREKEIVRGIVGLFGGAGFTVFLYYFTAALVLKLPPEAVSQIPFELEPVVRILWLAGLVPMLSGAGHILAGLLIRPTPADRQSTLQGNAEPAAAVLSPHTAENASLPRPGSPVSITEHTTNLLDPLSASRKDRLH